MRIFHLYHKISFAILRKKIKKNPYAGQETDDGTYLYTKDSYSISYRIIKLPEDKLCVEWISHRRRLSAYEERIKRIKKGFLDFWHYQKWLFFFRPTILLILIVGIFLFYSEMMETQETKMARLRWIVASAVGVSPKDVQYIGDGNLEISAQRKRMADKIHEPIRYTFNPLRWLFSSESGILTRWRGESFGYATHPVVINDNGDVWIKKKDTSWQHGIISGENIKWDTPLGSAKVTEQELIYSEDKKLEIRDK